MKDGLGKGTPHDCTHRKMLFTLNESPYYTATVIGSPKLGVATWNAAGAQVSPYNSKAVFQNYLNWDPAATNDPPGWSMSSPTGSDEIRLKEDVIEQAKGLKADVLLNIIEANQIWPSVQGLATGIPNMAYHWRNLRKVIKTASSTFLAWKFGVSPILSDIMSTARYLPKMEADVKRFADGNSSKFSRVGKLVGHFVPVDDSFGAYSDNRYAQGLMLKAPEVRYVLVVKPNQKYLTKAFQNLSRVMDRFTSSPASLAWEKIPFSFMVDWFVDLRGVMRTIDSALGITPYVVVSFTRSRSYHVSVQKFWTTSSPCSGSTLFDVRVGEAEYLHYERLAVSMGGSPPTWTPHFGNNQAAITAALILQKLKA
jgi:hypothetical protein